MKKWKDNWKNSIGKWKKCNLDENWLNQSNDALIEFEQHKKSIDNRNEFLIAIFYWNGSNGIFSYFFWCVWELIAMQYNRL